MATHDGGGSDSVRAFLYRTSGGFSALRSSDDAGASASINASASTGATTKATKMKTSKTLTQSKQLKQSKKLKHGGGSGSGDCDGGEMAGVVEGGDGRSDQIARLVSLESDLIGVLDDAYSLNSITRMQKVFSQAIADVRYAIAYIQANRCTRCNMLLKDVGPADTAHDKAAGTKRDYKPSGETAAERSDRNLTATELNALENIIGIPHSAGKSANVDSALASVEAELGKRPSPPKLGGTIHIMDNVDTGAVSVILGGVLRDAGIYAAQQ